MMPWASMYDLEPYDAIMVEVIPTDTPGCRRERRMTMPTGHIVSISNVCSPPIGVPRQSFKLSYGTEAERVDQGG